MSFRQMSSERKDRRHDPKEGSIHHVCEIAVAKTRPVESCSSFRAKDLLNAAARRVQKMVSKRAATGRGFAGRGGIARLPSAIWTKEDRFRKTFRRPRACRRGAFVIAEGNF